MTNAAGAAQNDLSPYKTCSAFLASQGLSQFIPDISPFDSWLPSWDVAFVYEVDVASDGSLTRELFTAPFQDGSSQQVSLDFNSTIYPDDPASEAYGPYTSFEGSSDEFGPYSATPESTPSPAGNGSFDCTVQGYDTTSTASFTNPSVCTNLDTETGGF